jgi:hypothetical protein
VKEGQGRECTSFGISILMHVPIDPQTMKKSQSFSNSLLLSGKINLFGFAPFDVAQLARDPMWSFNFWLPDLLI